MVRFEPGESAGYGQQSLPDVVLGPPRGRGEGSGSLHVLSLGRSGSIVLELAQDVVDGPGPDLIVFENAFRAGDGSLWAEPGVVGVSADGESFVDFPCAAEDEAGEWPGCAGVHPTLATDANGLAPYDPWVAGGDAFDLATIGVARARYVRIVDAGAATYVAPAGGFDLDAVAIVHPAVP